jgi:methylmalonyl-CoA mutase
MTEAPTALASDFPAPSWEDWLALVEKTLGPEKIGKGDLLTSMMSRIDDDYLIDPLYAAHNGVAPISATRAQPADPGRSWDLRTLIDDPDPAHANAQALADLSGGAASLTIAIDPWIRRGVAIASRDDLARVLDGVLLDLAPVGLKADLLGADAARWLGDLAKGAPAAPLAFNLDPLGAFAAWGRSPAPMPAIIDRDVQVASELAEAYPKARLFLASGVVVHEGGGSVGQELGFMTACALAYAKALAATGMPMAQAFNSITLCLSADADYFMTLAKFRAGRLIMTRLAAACGVAYTPRIEARSSRRMLTTLDAWTNLLRLQSACTGAALGGADIIQLDTFTFPTAALMTGRPSQLARRQARNIQLVLMEESELGRVADPAAGSWFFDYMTDSFARIGWAYFQLIEKQGGPLAALKLGDLQNRVDITSARRFRDLSERKTCMIGVSDFIDLEGAKPEIERWDKEPKTKHYPKLELRGEEDRCTLFVPRSLASGYENLRGRSRAKGDPTIYLATLGEVADFGPRTGFAKNLIATGGLKAKLGPASAYDPALTPIAILCGSDQAYAADAVSAAAALKGAGVQRLLLAGKPGDLEDALRAAGVDDFIFVGCDVVNAVHSMLRVFEPSWAEG